MTSGLDGARRQNEDGNAVPRAAFGPRSETGRQNTRATRMNRPTRRLLTKLVAKRSKQFSEVVGFAIGPRYTTFSHLRRFQMIHRLIRPDDVP